MGTEGRTPLAQRPAKSREDTSMGTWLRELEGWKKATLFSIALLAAGWSGHAIFAQQVGLPSTVLRNVARIDALEDRMAIMEEAVEDIAMNTERLLRLESKTDSLVFRTDATYCLVRAHSLNLDPLAECTLRQLGGGP